MFSSRYYLTLALFALSVTCLHITTTGSVVITEDAIQNDDIDISVGDVTIDEGVYWSIINNQDTTFAGSLTNNGGLYISSNSSLFGLSVTLLDTFGAIKNYGTLAFNSLESIFSPTYTLIGSSLYNSGDMFFGATGTTNPVISLTSYTWENEGSIVFQQNKRSSGYVNLGGFLGSITNNGQICFNNQVYIQTTSIKGSGCITAQNDTGIYISNSLLPVSTDQTIYLDGPSTSLKVEALSSTQTFTVAGFGNGNVIGLSLPITDWEYSDSQGILTLTNLLLSQKFNIGKGYDATKFSSVSDFGTGITSVVDGGLKYSEAPPNGTPSDCQACKAFPEAPGF